jgi:hypothetical protein
MTTSFSKSNLMTGIAFAALFGVVIVTLRLATGGYGGPSSIPECNSNTTRDMLQDAFKNAPQAALGLKLLKIGEIVRRRERLARRKRKSPPPRLRRRRLHEPSDGSRCFSTCPLPMPKRSKSISKPPCCRSDDEQEGSATSD